MMGFHPVLLLYLFRKSGKYFAGCLESSTLRGRVKILLYRKAGKTMGIVELKVPNFTPDHRVSPLRRSLSFVIHSDTGSRT